MLTILFYDGRNEEDGATFDFTADGFKALIATKVFRIAHITLDDGKRAIDLGIYQVKVANYFEQLEPKHPQHKEILRCCKQFRYLVGSP